MTEDSTVTDFPSALVEQSPDDLSEKALRQLDKRAESRRLKTAEEKEDDIHELRCQYLKRSFDLVTAVIAFSFLFLVWSGCDWLKLDSSVLIALLTTGAANVIGVLLVAFHWLFPSGRNVRK